MTSGDRFFLGLTSTVTAAHVLGLYTMGHAWPGVWVNVTYIGMLFLFVAYQAIRDALK